MAALAVTVVVLHQNTIVFMNTLHPGEIEGGRVGVEGADRGVGVAGIEGLPVEGRIGQIILADCIGVEYQLERVVRDPEDLSAESEMLVEPGIRLPAVDDPRLDLEMLRRPKLDSQSIEEPRCVG